MQLNNQEGMEFGWKRRGKRKMTKDWSKLNLFIRSGRSFMMLLVPTQVQQSLVRRLPKHFMSTADLTILRIPISFSIYILYVCIYIKETTP